MTNLPNGTVTFLFSDIEGSTRVSQRYPHRWETIRARHNAILQSAMQAHNGYVFQIIGDAFCVAFHTPADALRAALSSQLDLQAEDWGDTPIKVRIGIHTGQAEIQPGGLYQGYLVMSRVQRLMSAAHGGQTLLSLPAQELVRDDLPANVSLLYLGERRLKDLIRPEHIYQLVMEGLPVDFPPLKTLDTYRHNLPVQITSFIGREKELTDLRQVIASHRLVTLSGTGGTGKTRLALQVAAEVLDQFPEGVWFVELAPLTNPELIPQTILAALGIDEQAGLSSMQVLMENLRERSLLLILDNCEHLVSAAAELATILLNKAQQLKILATSREALKINGEQNWYVPSLSLPDLQHLPEAPVLSQYEAVRLFIDRALLVQPNFAVTNDNAPAIAQICHRLDGIPLAIELAAARVKALDVEQINHRLDDRFRLLNAGSRGIPRHQTLRAVIDWSHHLLSDQEKILFRRLSVFVGGCRLEEAEQVCALEADELDVFDLLANLIDKSLCVLEHTAGEARYGLLETTRQFACEKLSEAGEAQNLQNRHRDVYLELAERGSVELKSHDQLRWLHILEGETANLRAALECSFGAGQPAETGLRLVNAMSVFWDFGKNFNEAFPWLDKAYERSTVLMGTPLRAKLLYNRATDIFIILGKAQEAIPLLEESIEICRTLGDTYRVDLAYSLIQLGKILYFYRDRQIGLEYSLEALKLFQEAGDKRGQGGALNYLFDLISADGDFETACAMTAQGAALCKESGDEFYAALCLHNLGTYHLQIIGNYLEAERYFNEVLKIYLAFDSKGMVCQVLNGLGEIARSRDEYEKAEAYYRESLAMRKQAGFGPHWLIGCNLNLGLTVLRLGDDKAALSFFQETDRLNRNYKNAKWNQTLILMGIGGVAAFRGNGEDAALLLGAVAGAVQTILNEDRQRKIVIEPIDQREYDHYQALARSLCGDVVYQAQLEKGRALGLDEALAYALEKYPQQ